MLKDKKYRKILTILAPAMAEDGNRNPTDPPRDPPAEVPLTRADIPELVKAVVAAIGNTAETPKSPGK